MNRAPEDRRAGAKGLGWDAAGKIVTLREGRMLALTTGTSFDAATGTVADSCSRWVIYVPYATGESTGLGTKNLPGVPWLMDAGTTGAHIMISPVRPK